jgi:hypothetical protein
MEMEAAAMEVKFLGSQGHGGSGVNPRKRHQGFFVEQPANPAILLYHGRHRASRLDLKPGLLQLANQAQGTALVNR